MDSLDPQGAPQLTTRDGMIALALFCLAFAAYWLWTGTELYGDEAWYFYLAHTFGREPAAAADHALFHLLNRPLYYALFHLGTYAGFPGFRCVASVLGALVVVLCYAVARSMGATRTSAACVSAVLSLQRQLVEWGAHGFPDVLASAFALGAVWAAWQRRALASSLLAIACVLSKESFVALPLIAIAVRLWPARGERMRLDTWAWLSLLVPVAYVACVTLYGRLTPGIAMQGWSQRPFSWKYAEAMWVGPALWPIIAWLAWQRQARVLAIWLGLPLFYVVWSWGLGRGLSPWYATGPAYLGAVALARTLPRCVAAIELRYGLRPSQLLYAFVLASLVPIAIPGASRALGQVRALAHGGRDGAAASHVVAALEKAQPASVLLVNCFWAYSYAPMRAQSAPATRIAWARDDVADVLAAAREVDVTVVCRAPEHEAREQRVAAALRTSFEDRDFWVLRRK